MKSVLFYIARYPGYGGIESITTLFANHLASDLKYKVSIISCVQQDESILLEKLNSGILFYKLPNIKKINSEENQTFFNKIVEDNHIDTIIYQDSYYPNEDLLINVSNRNHINIICVEHNAPDCGIKSMRFAINSTPWYNIYRKIKINYFNRLGSIKEKKRKQKLYHFCNKYIVLSKGYIPIFLELNKISNPNKIEAIENPISIPIIDKFINKDNICLYVGRFSNQKGLMYLLNIWREVEKDKNCNDWKLILVGDGDKRLEVEKYICKENLKRVYLEGFKTNVIPYYKKASILCMTSIFEGFPMVLPEAMGYGVVPIAFNSFAAINDIIDNNKNGFIIKPYDIKAYKDSLVKLMKETELRQKLALNSIDKTKDFTPEKIWRKWDKVINK